MGYRPKPRQYLLKFRDAEFEGLEVLMGSMSVGEWEQMMAPSPDDPAERTKHNDWVLELFAARVVSWNLTDQRDKPVPATLKAIKQQDRPFMTALIAAWQLALLGVDPTSGSGSANGAETKPAMSAEDLETMAAMAASSSPGNSSPMT